MATISIEFGKESSQKTREVYLLVRQGKTRQRVKTGVRLNEQEYSPKTKKIKSIEKARIVEKLRLDLIDNMSNLTAGAMAGDPDDAHTITKKIIKKQEKKELEFFAYAEDWVSRAKIKGAKNYLTMLNTLEKFLECRKLFFQEITVTFLKDFEAFLDDRPRACVTSSVKRCWSTTPMMILSSRTTRSYATRHPSKCSKRVSGL